MGPTRRSGNRWIGASAGTSRTAPSLRRARNLSTTTGLDDDYVWGTSVVVGAVIPGDILQLRDHLVTKTATTNVTFEDGSGYESTEETSFKRPHHTAIVAENKGAYGLLVFEQNVDPGGKRVQKNTLLLAGSGPTVKTELRSVKHESGKLRRAKVVVTTTTRVSGKVWAYRPQEKQ